MPKDQKTCVSFVSVLIGSGLAIVGAVGSICLPKLDWEVVWAVVGALLSLYQAVDLFRDHVMPVLKLLLCLARLHTCADGVLASIYVLA
jgi:type III secretory pathway component EscS